VAPTLDEYHRRVRELVESVPPENRVVVARYARWSVTGPLQRKVNNGAAVTTELARWPLGKIKIAVRFATAISQAGVPLSQVSQTHLDAWISEFPSHRPTLRAFARWCSHHGYMASDIEVPAASSRELRRSLDDDDRLDLAKRLLYSAKRDDPRARLAALLILLFGQKNTAVASMPTAAVRFRAAREVEILLGSTAIRLREPMASLGTEVASRAQLLGSPWLFPSQQSGKHLTPAQLSRRMRKLGVPDLLLARNGARAALAERLPPALLADQLGVSLNAAVSWSKAVGAARGTYTGLRMGGTL
jgi:hypothetical protein